MGETALRLFLCDVFGEILATQCGARKLGDALWRCNSVLAKIAVEHRSRDRVRSL